MVFSSPIFLFLFLPLTLFLVLVIRKEFRNLVLLIASLVFYAWGEDEIVFIMFISILMNYVIGLLIERFRNRAKLLVGLAVTLNLLLLSFFKYFNFLMENLNSLLSALSLPVWEISQIHLPIGISFFTFQAMSYIIDVYRRDTPASRNPVNFALYIASFPQLIAGPIIRYRDVAHQLLFRTITLNQFSSGVNRFIIGLGKKVLIASTMARVADFIYQLPHHNLNFALTWTATIAFALQVYFDFSAYSDMAIGLGRMFGFEFKENFNYPYIAQSIREYWRRWHISLSTWFRDYLYIPLGGNRLSPWRTYLNLFTVFILVGLWHGASWNFIILGLIHGTFMSLERVGLDRILTRLWRPLRHFYMHVVLLTSLVFFRSENLPTALAFIKNMFLVAPQQTSYPVAYFLTNESLLIGLLAIVGCLPFAPWLKSRLGTLTPFPGSWLIRSGADSFAPIQVVFLLFVLVLSAFSLAAGIYQPFIYFRF